MRLDADDKIAPTYLEKTARVLDKEEKVAICYTNLAVFGEYAEKLTGDIFSPYYYGKKDGYYFLFSAP
ncbi:MAG: hypothetical protein QME40_07065 [bacterium]|nr:hypothetical protein [bacterium]